MLIIYHDDTTQKEDKIKDIVEKINEVKVKEFNRIWFKKNIIAEYVINENLYIFKEYELEDLWTEIKDKIQNDEIKGKLKNYCSGIYVPKNYKFV